MHILLILLFTLEASQIRTWEESLFVFTIWTVCMVYYKPQKETWNGLKVLASVEALMFILVIFIEGKPLLSIGPITITYEGIRQFILLFTRWFLSVSLTLTVVNRVGFGTIVEEMRKLKVPDILISILLLTYRYMHILIDTLKQMNMAIKMRGLKPSLWGEGRNISVSLLYNLFSSSMGRYEFIALSIQMRGGMYAPSHIYEERKLAEKPVIGTTLSLIIGGILLWFI